MARKNFWTFVICYCCLFSSVNLLGQKETLDSLKSELLIAHTDTGKLQLYLEFTNALLYNSPDSSIYWALRALDLSRHIDDSMRIAQANNLLGIANSIQGRYISGIEYFKDAGEIYQELGKVQGAADVVNNIGVLYGLLDNDEECIKSYLESAELCHKTGDAIGRATSLHNVASVKIDQGLFDEAKYYIQVVDSMIEIDSLKLDAYSLKAELFLQEGALDSAEYYILASKKSAIDQNDDMSVQYANLNMAELMLKRRKYNEALSLISNIEHTGIEKGYTSILMEMYPLKSDVFEQANNYEAALNCQKTFIHYKDSIQKSNNFNRFSELAAKYETEKQENEILEQQRIIAERENFIERKKSETTIFILAIITFVIISVISIINTQKKKKTNRLLNLQNQEIVAQRRKIVSSINYAKKIQNSILIPEERIKEHLPNSFIYSKPKDIVSGDFYWFKDLGDKIILAAIDCTGHGIPGAFMSLIANSKLNNIINERKILDPGEILCQLHQEINSALSQTEFQENAQDGMDMSLCVIDAANSKLLIAGANNSLFITRGGEVQEIKVDFNSIGGSFFNKRAEKGQLFTTREVAYEKDSYLFLCTDGYIDQFGGEDNKKLNKARFKDIILRLSRENLVNAHQKFESYLNAWKGNTPQLDDILIIGTRL